MTLKNYVFDPNLTDCLPENHKDPGFRTSSICSCCGRHWYPIMFSRKMLCIPSRKAESLFEFHLSIKERHVCNDKKERERERETMRLTRPPKHKKKILINVAR